MMPLTDALVGRDGVQLAAGSADERCAAPCRPAVPIVAPDRLHAVTLLLPFCSVSGCLAGPPLLTPAGRSHELSVTT